MTLFSEFQFVAILVGISEAIKRRQKITLEHDFNGHVINGIHEVNGKKCYYRAFHLVNKLYDFTGMLDLSGNFCYDDFFRKNHARL